MTPSVNMTGLLRLVILCVCVSESQLARTGRSQVKERCPGQHDWKLAENSCYLVVHSLRSEYLHVYQAREECQRLGADLASFPNYGVEQLVYQELEGSIKPSLKMYIGINDCCDNSTEGIYTWIDGVVLNFTNWGEEEPNNLHKGDEDCAVTSVNKRWQDYPCCEPAQISAVLCMKYASDFPLARTPRIPSDRFRLVCRDDKCGKRPCLNGGVCVPVQPKSFRCLCPDHSTGHWCETELQCLDPPYIEHSVRQGSVHSHGSILFYTCDLGFMFPDKTFNKNMTCNSTIWTPALPHCIEMKCTAIPTWNGLIPGSKERVVGTEVNYTCDSGLVFQDRALNKTTTCNMSRLWDPALEPCMQEHPEEKRSDPPVEATGAVALGTVAVLFMACELALFILMDLTTMRRQFAVMKENLRQWSQRL